MLLIWRQHIARPKRRNLVLSEFIQACLDEETLLDEAGMLKPKAQVEKLRWHKLTQISPLDYHEETIVIAWEVE